VAVSEPVRLDCGCWAVGARVVKPSADCTLAKELGRVPCAPAPAPAMTKGKRR
jgi:hypothetical protein